MTTQTCGCAREDNVFLPCPTHKQMMDEANAFQAAIINHQAKALRKEFERYKAALQEIHDEAQRIISRFATLPQLEMFVISVKEKANAALAVS